MNWQAFAQAILQTEQTFIPMFVHNPASGKIAGIVLLAESVVASALTSAGVIPGAPVRSQDPSTPPAAGQTH